MGKLRIFLTFPFLLPFQPKDLQPTKQQKHLVHVNTFRALGFVREAVRDICYAMLPAYMTCQPQEFFPEAAFFPPWDCVGLCSRQVLHICWQTKAEGLYGSRNLNTGVFGNRRKEHKQHSKTKPLRELSAEGGDSVYIKPKFL